MPACARASFATRANVTGEMLRCSVGFQWDHTPRSEGCAVLEVQRAADEHCCVLGPVSQQMLAQLGLLAVGNTQVSGHQRTSTRRNGGMSVDRRGRAAT